MDIWKKYKSPLGYYNNDNQIDSYGVDHSGFSTRDELNYQMARQQKEDAMLQQYNNQGITSNYPQYTTNFWSNSADNNYGFGSSDIEGNVENVKKQLNNPTNNLWQKVKDVATIATDTIRYTPEETWFKLKSLGELAANTKIAYDYWKEMNKTGSQLVETFGPGQGANIDNYYHPLLQCQLAKISPTSRDWGLRLGYAKEILDYHKKKGTMPMSEISADSRKDLQNNLYGSNLGHYNPNKSCWEMLDDQRTPNMRKANIR